MILFPTYVPAFLQGPTEKFSGWQRILTEAFARRAASLPSPPSWFVSKPAQPILIKTRGNQKDPTATSTTGYSNVMYIELMYGNIKPLQHCFRVSQPHVQRTNITENEIVQLGWAKAPLHQTIPASLVAPGHTLRCIDSEASSPNFVFEAVALRNWILTLKTFVKWTFWFQTPRTNKVKTNSK